MSAPPTRLRMAGNNRSERLPATGDRIAAYKSARRAGIAQCSTCGAKGTAALVGRKVVGSTLPLSHANGMRHKGCGGRIEAFDIAEVDQ